jgi:hypothetical protein
LPIHYRAPNIVEFPHNRLSRLAGLVSAIDTLVISGGIAPKHTPIIPRRSQQTKRFTIIAETNAAN